MRSPGDKVTIENVRVRSFTIPTDFPESDGTLEWDSTTIIVAEIVAGGRTGIGYTYADTATAELASRTLAPVITGMNAMSTNACWWAMVRRVRNLGRPGVASMAISSLDTALWDLKSKLLDVPLVTLIGGAVRESVPVYGSGGFTSYSEQQLVQQLGGWAAQGIQKVKMKIGRDAAADQKRVRMAREAISPEVELFVDANGAYERKLALAQAERFAEFDVRWFEEPVSSDDLEGLRLIRDRAPAGMDIAAGEYGYTAEYFRRMLEAGAVDVLQADATRCGGFTGFIQAANLCVAHGVPLSSHTAPLLHTALGCALQPIVHLEYFHDHVRIERMLFEGAPELKNGALRVNVSAPGLGVEFRRADAERIAA